MCVCVCVCVSVSCVCVCDCVCVCVSVSFRPKEEGQKQIEDILGAYSEYHSILKS